MSRSIRVPFVLSALLVGVIGSANAALPTAVTDAITAAQTDGVTAVGLLAAMGAAVFLLRKVLGRLGIM